MRKSRKIATATAALALTGAMLLPASPATAAPVQTAPAIGGGYMPNPPKSLGPCWAALILTPWDKQAIKRWC